MVADDAVECGDRGLPAPRNRPIVPRLAEVRRGGADASAGQPERAADAAIDEARRAARHALRYRGEARRLEDGHVHVLDEAGQAVRRVRGEPAEAEDIRKREGGRLGGHGIFL